MSFGFLYEVASVVAVAVAFGRDWLSEGRDDWELPKDGAFSCETLMLVELSDPVRCICFRWLSDNELG